MHIVSRPPRYFLLFLVILVKRWGQINFQRAMFRPNSAVRSSLLPACRGLRHSAGSSHPLNRGSYLVASRSMPCSVPSFPARRGVPSSALHLPPPAAKMHSVAEVNGPCARLYYTAKQRPVVLLYTNSLAQFRMSAHHHPVVFLPPPAHCAMASANVGPSAAINRTTLVYTVVL